MSEKYFPAELQTEQQWNICWEMRADLAWELVRHFGSVAADIKGEDSAGRAKLMLQEPQELVARCFAIADSFVLTAENRGDFKAVTITPEEKMQKIGELAAIRSNAEWKRNKSPAAK